MLSPLLRRIPEACLGFIPTRRSARRPLSCLVSTSHTELGARAESLQLQCFIYSLASMPAPLYTSISATSRTRSGLAAHDIQ